MSKSIQNFQSSRLKRLMQLKKELEKNNTYQKYSYEIQNFYEQLVKALPKRLKVVFLKYTGKIDYLNTFQNEFYYDNGFIDGVELMLPLCKDLDKTDGKMH